MTKKEDAFYKKLKDSLNETTKFPSDYMFKFIIPSRKELKLQIQTIFNMKGAVLTTKPSKSGKFISYTILLNVKKATEVIEIYKQTSKVKGIISL